MKGLLKFRLRNTLIVIYLAYVTTTSDIIELTLVIIKVGLCYCVYCVRLCVYS